MNFYSSSRSTVKVKVQLLDSQISRTVNAVYGWQRLSINFGATLDHDWADNATYSNTFNYTRLEIFPNFGVVDSGVAYFVDDIAFNGAVTPVLTQAKLNQSIAATATTLKRAHSATLPAKTSRGLNITWVSSTTAVCTISGYKVKALKTGVCRISGRNTGNAGYNSVTTTRILTVTR